MSQHSFRISSSQLPSCRLLHLTCHLRRISKNQLEAFSLTWIQILYLPLLESVKSVKWIVDLCLTVHYQNAAFIEDVVVGWIGPSEFLSWHCSPPQHSHHRRFCRHGAVVTAECFCCAVETKQMLFIYQLPKTKHDRKPFGFRSKMLPNVILFHNRDI